MTDHRPEVLILRLDADLPVPSYAHPGDAGADLVTRVDVTLQPGSVSPCRQVSHWPYLTG